MSLRIRLTKDDISPDLRRKIAACSNPRPLLLAAGTQLVSITKRAFRDPSLRQSPWPTKRDGSPSNLIEKGMLVSSIRITSLDSHSVTIGSDRKYSTIHQLGGVIKAKGGKALVFYLGGKKIFAKQVSIPARPYFPFTPDGRVAAFAVPKVAAILEQELARQMGT